MFAFTDRDVSSNVVDRVFYHHVFITHIPVVLVQCEEGNYVNTSNRECVHAKRTRGHGNNNT